MRSFVALTKTDLGFHPESVLVATAHIPAHTKRAEYVRVVRELSGVSAALGRCRAFARSPRDWACRRAVNGSNGSFTVEGMHPSTLGRALP